MSTTRILKYPVLGGSVTTITCRLRRLLDIQLQRGELVCWIETSDDIPETTTKLLSIGTGWDIPSETLNKAIYLKTVQDDYGYVWHFYDYVGDQLCAKKENC